MKPKYHIFNNAKYALEGVIALFKNEMAFRIEICIIIPAIFISFFLKISLIEHLILIAVLILVLIAESFNSAIEACVDLITDKWHQKAKIAKDCASAGVFFSVVLAVFSWIFIIVGLI
ncbi:diacylglycerol kinase [Campylobacter sp. W0065]|uniref:diacylglycerol kinase n=1 Tax=Campylobacter molothri TaxID=1032242 RepID=UPI00301C1069|nr:diacylglycerol kinase [Campylobacter sp. W0065]